MNLIIQYGLRGLLLGLGLGLGLILYCRIWRPLALPYICPQPRIPRPLDPAYFSYMYSVLSDNPASWTVLLYNTLCAYFALRALIK